MDTSGFILFGVYFHPSTYIIWDELQRSRGRQGLLPYFRLQLPSPARESEYQLAELKMIGAVAKWYPRSGALARRKSGVDRRVIPLPSEYSKPLAKLDRKYHGVAEGQVGPLQRRFEGYGRLQCREHFRRAVRTSMLSWKLWQTQN